MTISRALMMALCASSAFVTTGCGLSEVLQPVGPPSVNYVGEWDAVGHDLSISPEGMVVYEARSGSVSKSLSAPILSWNEGGFEAGLGGPLVVSFAVDVPPHLDGVVWKMTVDGVEYEQPTRMADYPYAGRDMSR